MSYEYYVLHWHNLIDYFVGHQEKEGQDHGLVLESVNTESARVLDQEKERGSHQGHTQVKEELEKEKKKDRKKGYLLSDQKH